MFSFTNPKRLLEEAEAQISKINSKGGTFFLAEYMRIISNVGFIGKKSHYQANHP